MKYMYGKSRLCGDLNGGPPLVDDGLKRSNKIAFVTSVLGKRLEYEINFCPCVLLK